MWNKHRYCSQLQNHVWIQKFCGEKWKASILWESSYFVMVLWYGGSCKEVCGAILWVGQQDASTTQQSYNSMPWWPSIQRRNEICWRIVTSMLSNCSEMLVHGKNWTTWHSMVSEQTCTIDYEMDQSLWQTTESFDIFKSITHVTINNIVMWANTAKQWRLGLKTLILQEI